MELTVKSKTILLMMITIMLISGSSIFYFGRVLKDNQEKEYTQLANNLADTIALSVDAKSVEVLREEVKGRFDSVPVEERVNNSADRDSKPYKAYIARFSDIEETEAFREVYSQLHDIQTANQIHSVYITYLDEPSASAVYLVDASDKDICHPGSFDGLAEWDVPTLESPEVGLGPSLFESEPGQWSITTGKPIFGKDGFPIAYACVDVSLEKTIASRNRMLQNTALAVFVLAILFGVVGMYLSDQLLSAPLNAQSELLKENRYLEEANQSLVRKARAAQQIASLTNSVRLLLNNMPAMTYSKDVKTHKYLACNQKFAEFAGKVSPDEIIGLTDEEVFDPEVMDKLRASDETALAMSEPFVIHEEIVDPSGQKKYLQTIRLKFVDAAGNECILGMSVDVTEIVEARRENLKTKLAFEKAKEESITYSHISRALAHDYTFVYYVDLQTDEFIEYSFVVGEMNITPSRDGRDFFGASREDAMKLLHPEDRASFIQAFTKENVLRTIERKGTFTRIYRLMIDGEPVFMNMKAVRIADDSSHLIIGISDVNEQIKGNREQERLKEEQVTFARISALSGKYLCIYAVDPKTDRYVEYLSTSDYRSIGLERKGKDFFVETRQAIDKAIYEEDRILCQNALEKDTVLRGIERNGVYSLEYRLMIFGKPTYVNLRATMIEEKDGPQLIIGVTNIDTRVRREKEYAANLEEALVEARKANAAKSVFLSNMSHEIRTPINAILGMNEIIRRDSNDERILSCTGNIKKAGTSLLGIISDILDFSKIEAGKLTLYSEPYHVPELFSDIYNLIRFRAESKEITLVFDIDPDIPVQLQGDELRIKQVLTNLLTNAVKYTEQGSVTLRVSVIRRDGQAGLRFAVIDTGIGIKEEEKSRLFTSFARLDTKRTRTIEGAGLGLTITSMLLQMMGTQLSVESTYDVGSTFSFDLTQKIIDAAPIGENWMDAALSVAGRDEEEELAFTAPDSHILIVDDTVLNLEVIRGLLEPTKIQIDTAESGEACIRMFAQKDYDAVFLDYLMPEMDGIETLGRLKSEYPAKANATPIISLTASAVAGERERMLGVGFTDYITKPVIVAELMEMLIKYLPEDKVERTQEPMAEAQDVFMDGIPDRLLAIPWVDAREGVEYCGNPDMYLSILGMFAKGIEDKATQLEEALASDDIELFTIKVHALKSSSLTMGMADFSARAKELELAGKGGDVDLIREKFPRFVEDYRSMGPVLMEALEA